MVHGDARTSHDIVTKVLKDICAKNGLGWVDAQATLLEHLQDTADVLDMLLPRVIGNDEVVNVCKCKLSTPRTLQLIIHHLLKLSRGVFEPKRHAGVRKQHWRKVLANPPEEGSGDVIQVHLDLVESRLQIKCSEVPLLAGLPQQVLSAMRPVVVQHSVLVEGDVVHTKTLV